MTTRLPPAPGQETIHSDNTPLACERRPAGQRSGAETTQPRRKHGPATGWDAGRPAAGGGPRGGRRSCSGSSGGGSCGCSSAGR
jgi:hypothetical protein